VQTLAPGAKEWTSIGLPGDNRGYEDHGAPWLAAGRSGEIVLAWSEDSGNVHAIQVARHDAKGWVNLATDLGDPAQVKVIAGLAGHPDGKVGVLYTEGPYEGDVLRGALLAPK
jgi:hypothetical protein